MLKRAAIVLVSDGKGRLLFGKRLEDSKWTPPAGNLNEGEDPEKGARRELYEETGLKPEFLTHLKTQKQIEPDGDETELYCYTAQCVDSIPHGRKDPDHEVDKWQWVDCRGGIPKNIYDSLNGPEGKGNVVRQIYDLKKSERVWLDAGFADLRKGLDKGQGASKFSEIKAPEKNLIFCHNLSEENLKHAHELGGLVAPSIAIKHADHPFTGFGEVTLIAHPSTFDPENTPTFAADAYSPRHPRPNYEINQGKLKELQKELRPHAEMLGRHSYLMNSLEDDIEKQGVQRPLEDHSFVPVMKAAFLASKGIKVEPVLREAGMRWPDEMKTKAMRKFFQDNGHTGNGKPEEGFSPEYHKALSKAYGEAVKEMFGKVKGGSAKEAMKEYWLQKVDKKGLLHGGYTYNFMADAEKYNQKEPDVPKTVASIEKHFEPQWQKEFDRWALAKIRPVQSTPYIPKHNPNTGRVKKIPYTIHNVLKEMTKRIRSMEGFNYGLGNARSKGTSQLKTLDQVKMAANKLVPEDEFEEAKKQNADRFFELAGKIHRDADYGSNDFSKLDAITEALGESFKPGRSLRTELGKSGFSGVPDHIVLQLKSFGNMLLDMPSEYFESKPQRIVALKEFKGAVIPSRANRDTLRILKEHGIKNIERYENDDPDGSQRNAAVKRLAAKNDLMLSEDDLFEFELLQKAEEPLEKMALIHNDPKNPKIVYRVQNEKGIGPYNAHHDVPFSSLEAWKSEKARQLAMERTRAVEEGDRGYDRRSPSTKGDLNEPQPSPYQDFSYGREYQGKVFGFESPMHARYWFGDRNLAEMAKVGFHLTPVKAAVVYRSESGKQVAFIPHSLLKPKHESFPEGGVEAYHVPKEDIVERGQLDLPGIKKSEVFDDQGPERFESLEKYEDLAKMAITAIKPGKLISKGRTEFDVNKFDYSHLLPNVVDPGGEADSSKMGLTVAHSNHTYDDRRRVVAHLHYGGRLGREVGKVAANIGGNGVINIGFAQIEAPFRGKGYGKALYEALAAHAYHHLGAKTIEGDFHSTSAHNTHQALARKHGTSYNAKPNRNIPAVDARHPHAFDDAYGPYSYHIKSELRKSETEVDKLLTHPNPVERSLALKLDSVTPEDIGVAILDPDDFVWRNAFNHKDSGHALDVLASNTRDASGNVLFDRHDALMNDPRCLQRHLEGMIEATKRDSYLPLAQQAERVYKLRGHPLAQHESLYKSEDWGQDTIIRGTANKALTSAAGEEVPEHLKPLAEAYQKHFKDPKPTVYHNDIYETDNVAPKVMYQVPVEGVPEPQQLMVRPYREKGHLLSGWAEGSTQALYHAAGMGELCQKSFSQPYGKIEKQVPVTVIHVTKGVPALSIPQSKLLEGNPTAKEDARKIALMDFLTDNPNRHSGHLLVTPEMKLQAIDHSGSFEYDQDDLDLQKYAGYGPGVISSWHPADYEETLKWWPQVQEEVRNAFKKRLDLVTDDSTKEFLDKEFERRASWLDEVSGEALHRHFTEGVTVSNPEEDLTAKYLDNSQKIKKALGGMEKVLERPNHDLIDYDKLNSGLGVNQEHQQYFHQNLNGPEQEAKPYLGVGGSESKKVFKHADRKFLVKSPEWTRRIEGETVHLHPAWNEMASQALYHAAGIGHLHQSSHIALHKGAPALVVHMEPDVKTHFDLETEDNPERLHKMLESPQHLAELRKMAAMEYVTANYDRHPDNLMVRADGTPYAIDHSTAFIHDHHYASGRIADIQSQHNSTPDLFKPWDKGGISMSYHLGGDFTPEDRVWWNNSKDKIHEAFVNHLQTIKDPAYRKKLLKSFEERMNNFDSIADKAGLEEFPDPKSLFPPENKPLTP
jgi:ADP-ribose pyrophosphatase